MARGLTYYDQFISAYYMTVKIKLKRKVGGGGGCSKLSANTGEDINQSIVNNVAHLP